MRGLRWMLWIVGCLALAGCHKVASQATVQTVEQPAPPSPGASKTAATSSRTAEGILYYVDTSSHGVDSVKLKTASGVRLFVVDPESHEGRLASKVSYVLGQRYRVVYVVDANGDTIQRIGPLAPKDSPIGPALDVVNRFYNEIYFFRLDSAYELLSSAEKQRTSRQEFKAEWPGSELTQQVDWNGSFKPRRVALDRASADLVVCLADITRLFAHPDRTQVRRLHLVREDGAWKIDRIERARVDDFLQTN